MKKTPTALRWLAEKRARTAGDLASCCRAAEMIAMEIEAMQSDLFLSQQYLEAAIAKKDRLTTDLAALDQTLVIYDSGIRPGEIEPIRSWSGQYGKRGALKDFLIETLKSRSPEFVSSTELSLIVIMRFSLHFDNKEAKTHWYKGAFKNTLKVLAAQGRVERGTGRLVLSGTPGIWRWKSTEQPTLAELAKQ
jgi:hypothetical protein